MNPQNVALGFGTGMILELLLQFSFKRIANERKYLKVLFWMFTLTGTVIGGIIRIQYSPLQDEEIHEILGFIIALTFSFLFQSRN